MSIWISNRVLILFVAGARLQNNVSKESQTYSEIECAYLCLCEYPLCKSFNYKVKDGMRSGSTHKCQLNNAIKSLQAKHFVKDEAFNYFEVMKQVIIKLLLENKYAETGADPEAKFRGGVGKFAKVATHRQGGQEACRHRTF